MNKALLLEELSLSVGGRQIFSNVYMEAERGEILAVCGTASSHMYYLAKLLSRSYEAPYSLSGRLFVDEADIERLNEEEMRFFRMMNVAILPSVNEESTLRMSVQKYILLPFREGVKKTNHDILTDTKRIMQLLGAENPERILRKKMNALSIKDLRAVLYAAALATDPAVAIFFADTADMSAQEADELYALLIKVAKIKNITLLLLTTDLPLARRYGEKVYIAKKDRIFLSDEAARPLVHFLEAAAEMKQLILPPAGEKELLSAASVVPARKMQRMHFKLHDQEILALPAQNGIAVFSGACKPVSGRLAAGGVPIQKNKTYRKTAMPVYAGMVFPPAASVDAVLRAFALRPSVRVSPTQIYTALGLPADYGKMPMPVGNMYETLRLGIICAAAAEVPVILLSDIDRIQAPADRYEILSLLSAVCAETGAGALVFSDRADVRHALSGDFAPGSSLPAVAEEETVISLT